MMKQRESRTPLIEDELCGALEELRQMTEATALRLVHWSIAGCCADNRATTEGNEKVGFCIITEGCSRWAQGGARLLMAIPAQWVDGAALMACAHCQLTNGEGLALQLGFSDASPFSASDFNELTRLSIPILMWAKHTVERQMLERRLAEMEERYRNDRFMAIQTQEDEREWLTLEVHDRVAQPLAAVFQQLQTLESLTQSLPEIRQVAVRGSLLCREAIREARNIMNDLHPPPLEELGLMALVEEELHRLEKDLGCRVKEKLTCKMRPPRAVEVALYRIVQESLINIRRHANATTVILSLECESNEVRLQVEDNGAGFDVPDALAKKQMGGLISMQRRAERAGGVCHIESMPGKGTTVSVGVPLWAQ